MSQFKESDLNELLDAKKYDHELHQKLEIGREYMLYCSTCIIPRKLLIEDEVGLLKRFEEVFYAIQNIVEIFSPKLSQKINEIESTLCLSQNVVKLGMVNGALIPQSKGKFSKLLGPTPHQLELPEKGATSVSSQLLLEIQTALTRLGGMCGSAAREAKEWWYSNEDVFVIDDFYDPRNVSKSYLKILIGNIKQSLKDDPKVPHAVIVKLGDELNNIEKELDKNKTSWNKVLSKISQTVLILAAVVTITANLDDAYNNALKAFHYISKQSISLPSQPNKQDNIPKISGIVSEEKDSNNNDKSEGKNE